MNTDAEEKALTLIMPFLEEVCQRRWINLEYEDRLAEACLVFIYAFRTIPIYTGNFLTDFIHVLIPHMNEVNRNAPSKYYGDYSLDDALHTENDSKNYCRYAFLKSPAYDESSLYVNSFLEKLPQEERNLIYEVYSMGLPKAEIARKHGISVYQLRSILKQIGKEYLREVQ